jgi:hypothetical protein
MVVNEESPMGRYRSAVGAARTHAKNAEAIHAEITLSERTAGSPDRPDGEFHREAVLASTWALIAAAVKP